jgi:hypothetical protein
VLLAILLSVRTNLRAAAFAAAFATIWTAAVTLYWGRILGALFPQFVQSFASSWGQLPWPWSVTYEIAVLAVLSAIPVAIGLSQYLLLLKKFDLAGFSRGVAVALIFQAVRTLSVAALRYSRTPSIAISFTILLLSMWAARSAKAQRRFNSGMTTTTPD